MKCPNCQYENRDDAKFCKSCGTKLTVPVNPPIPQAPEEVPPVPAAAPPVCPNCGSTVKMGAKFCAKCGSSLNAGAPTAPLQPGPSVYVDGPFPSPVDTPVENTASYTDNTLDVPPYADAPFDASVLDATISTSSPADASMGGPLFADIPVMESPLSDPSINGSSMGGSIFADTMMDGTSSYPNNNTVFDSSMGATLYSDHTLFNNPPAADTVPIPSAPDMTMPSGSPAFCKKCGAPLKPNVKFCSKCGAVIDTPSAPADSTPAKEPRQNPEPAPVPVDPPKPEKKKKADKKQDKAADSGEKKKNPLVIVLIVLIVLLLLAVGAFALIKTGIIDLSSKDSSETTEEEVTEEIETEAEDETDVEEPETAEEDLSGLEEELAPLSDQVSAAEEKLNNEDYGGASSDLYNILTTYADLAGAYDSQAAIDKISPAADAAFASYTKAVLKQVESWESQPVTAPLYQQIDITLGGASELASQLKESGLSVAADELDQNYAEFPGRYKEKYILTFNDLRTGDEWSRTTAWQYMQDAASVGLVDKSNPDDPLTLRYAYALAWITQRDISEGMKDGSLTTEDAIASILSLAESMDYNPVLMRDLALYYDAVGDSSRSKVIQDACVDVYNYLANQETVFINGEELFVPGRSSSNASSTISLNDFWYFNDFGEYAPSSNNGVSPAGREQIRTYFKEAVASL